MWLLLFGDQISFWTPRSVKMVVQWAIYLKSSFQTLTRIGQAEAAFKSAKRCIRKAAKSEKDPYLPLLDVQNTPLEGSNTSPTQRSLG